MVADAALYIVHRNGVQVGTTATNSFVDSGLSPNTTYAYRVAARDSAENTTAQTLCVGGEVNGTSCDRYFDGAIDEFQIYNRALTPSEIQALGTP